MQYVKYVAAAAVMFVAAPSFGFLTLVSDTRFISARASAMSGGNSVVDGPSMRGPSGFGAAFSDDVNAGAVIIGAGAGAAASQSSQLGVERLTLLGSVSTSASAGAGASAMSRGVSSIDLVVDLPGNTLLTIVASVTGDARFEVRDASDTLIFGGSGVLDRRLGGGRMHIIAVADAAATAPGETSGGGAFSVSFITVPGPGGAGALLLGGAAILRRRRR